MDKKKVEVELFTFELKELMLRLKLFIESNDNKK